MKHLAAYCLLVLSGNANPSEADITKLMKEVGATVDKDNLTQMMTQLKGKKVHDLIKEGSKKLASVPSGGASAGGAAAGGAAVEGAKPVAAKKEEPKEEAADVDMGGLFGDEY